MFYLQVRVTVKDKNDSPPSFSDTPLKFSVSEDLSPGLYVATIKAHDPDTLGQLQYSLISGSDNHFALDPDTGVLTLIDSLDRETKEVHKITVRANDGIQSTDTTVIIQ
ncbi:Cadherin domain, partial [Popillia japonica]